MSLQRCEGKNLESVLEEVRNRFGDTVTIVEANRLRKGGVGGFFARERFEVVVDAVDVVDDEPSDGPGAPIEIPAEFGLEATEDFCERLLSMADGVRDEPAASPAVSTEQPAFSAILESLTRHMEVEPATGIPAVPAPPATVGSPAAPAAPTNPYARAVPAPAEPAGEVAGPAIRMPAPEPRPGIDNRALARIGLPEDLRRAALAHPAPAAGTDPAAWLLGLLADLPRPAPLPQRQGSIIVVAGAREAALALARSLGDELGLDPEALFIASPGYTGRARAIPGHRRLHDAGAAAEARRSWRRRPRTTIVAVEAPTGRPADWARRVIDALEPTMVWAAVEATRKPDDLFEWAEQLGGFDALGVSDLDATVSPAAVLQCGIPVGRLEGRPATPALWTALIAPRLAS